MSRREPVELDTLHGRPSISRRPGLTSNTWGPVEAEKSSPDSTDSRSEKGEGSESQYTDADSVASDAFESGAEEVSDDEGVSRRREGPQQVVRENEAENVGRVYDSLAVDMGRVSLSARERVSVATETETRPTTTHHNDFSEAEVREAFAAFDEDGDGLLDVHDVLSFFGALGETLTLHETAELIKLVDGDDDGRVDFDEFFDLATRSAQFVNAE